MAFSPFTLDEQCLYGLVMLNSFNTSHQLLLPHHAILPPPISTNDVYKTSVSKSQFKWTHPFVQQKVASGVAPHEAHRPELHMVGLQTQTGYDLFTTTMCICCPVPAGCGFTCLPQSGMTSLLTVSYFRYFPCWGKRDGQPAGGLHTQMSLTLLAT